MVQVIIKAFDILELVARKNGQAISLTEISEELNLNQATVANIINTMVSKGYLEHIGKKKGYKLGLSAYSLTNEVSYEKDLVNAAKDVMDELTKNLNESCILGVLQNFKRYILHVVNSNHDIQVQIRSERNVYETASGRLLIAYLSPKDLDRFLKQNGLPDKLIWEEATTLKGLTNALTKIKEEGVSKTSFKDKHLKGFAVPIFRNDKVVAGLSIFLPEYRCPISRENEIIKNLLNASVTISKKLSDTSSL
ncbi:MULTISPECIES: IclR family transcriptional regulator C-terminal domain-containing protein [unclassified Arcicella]|uniref:IclR family transcriptional regulator n=1 Tax=unclassified Arcicella TaxID=2644986 RepID=UPI00285CA68C|nr:MULTISPECIES: IclR family transcriptional regulator C-terminal domain-containing protein [unclassified Arcicella]MDR6562286.1 DNA-binding IclR family transcriptional regulator [Arcicella sp. BE51]MDR6812020.1 DNA-binding IclR family transcriptional regulator [Arcicella sp. BE140]MDR6823331.1 DNA-binding IclR family transcriptional regulator [Arcicella sp. BE139]